VLVVLKLLPSFYVMLVIFKQARSQGGDWGNVPPNSERCPKNFQGNQGFDA